MELGMEPKGGDAPRAWPLEEVAGRIAGLRDWRAEDGKRIVKDLRFPDFAAALAFVVAVGGLAEVHQHHPDVELGYGRVRLSLTTHACGGLTDRDLALALAIDRLPTPPR